MSRGRLPSVETQTVAFVEAARAARRRSAGWLKFSGFRVYLRYEPVYKSGDMELGETLVIANVRSPAYFRDRGWFLHYCELCAGLIDCAVVIECVYNPRLYASLSRRKSFRETMFREFVLLKRRPGEASRIVIGPVPER